MIGTALGATLGSQAALKLAIGTLTTALTVGGTAAVTGNLPDSAQCIVADAAAHIGLTLPRPELAAHGDTGLVIDNVVEVGGAADLALTTPEIPQVAIDNTAGLSVCVGNGSAGTDGNVGTDATATVDSRSVETNGSFHADGTAVTHPSEGANAFDGAEPEGHGADDTAASDGSTDPAWVGGFIVGGANVDLDAGASMADTSDRVILNLMLNHGTGGDTGLFLSVNAEADGVAHLQEQVAAVVATCLALSLG